MPSTHLLARTGASVVPLLLALSLAGLAGCDGIEPADISTPLGTDADFFAHLVVNRHAATLSTVAPYDTLQLTATPTDLSDELIPDLPAPTFYTPDTAFLAVTSDGLVRARRAGTDKQVIVFLKLPGNSGHADTTWIDITDEAAPPRLASLSIDPPAGDSAVIGMALAYTPGGPSGLAPEVTAAMQDVTPYDQEVVDFSTSFSRYANSICIYFITGCLPTPTIVALDDAGNTMPNLRVEVRPLDPDIGVIGNGFGNPSDILDHLLKQVDARVGDLIMIGVIRPGHARLEARMTAYGITLVDTVTWHITPPPYTQIHYAPKRDGTIGFLPSRVTIRRFGGVGWWNWTDDPTDVVFEDPTHVALAPADVCQMFTTPVFDAYYYNLDGPHCGTGNVVLPAMRPESETPAGVNFPGLRVRWNSQVRYFPVAGTYRYHDPRTGATGEIVVSDE